jgi:hypothetical protein
MRPSSDERYNPGQTYDNRLMPRYTVTTRVQVEWLTSRRRKGLRRRDVVPMADVLDVSMGGMLVEAPGDPPLDVNSRVELASAGNPATARVAHKHVALDPDKQLLGLELVDMSEGFMADLHALIQVLRGD